MNEALMREAVALAVRNVESGEGGPFAALVVRDGAVLARGTNRVTGTNDPTAHAEILAIREACRVLGHFQLAGCDVYATCEPCPMCLGALYWARPSRVFYAATREDAARAGFDDARIYGELGRPPGERGIPMEQVPLGPAQEPFEAWMRRADRTPY